MLFDLKPYASTMPQWHHKTNDLHISGTLASVDVPPTYACPLEDMGYGGEGPSPALDVGWEGVIEYNLYCPSHLHVQKGLRV